jgi:hypothetical protein
MWVGSMMPDIRGRLSVHSYKNIRRQQGGTKMWVGNMMPDIRGRLSVHSYKNIRRQQKRVI